MAGRFYLTTAIAYVNGPPHLGHAYEKITADAIARYQRLSGADTWFVIGNDEHSQNVYRLAKEQGLDPLAYCDRMEREYRAAWDLLDISYDDFIRTTQPRHKAAVQELVRRISANGDVYEGFYEGWYCIGCEAFKQEKDLVDGRCPLHVIGKDITRFHTVIWPAMLMSAGLPLPRQVFGHGFMSVDGQRMSKTLGNVVDPVDAVRKVGVDPLRLYLIKEVTYGGDGDFS